MFGCGGSEDGQPLEIASRRARERVAAAHSRVSSVDGAGANQAQKSARSSSACAGPLFAWRVYHRSRERQQIKGTHQPIRLVLEFAVPVASVSPVLADPFRAGCEHFETLCPDPARDLGNGGLRIALEREDVQIQVQQSLYEPLAFGFGACLGIGTT
jgi:hypothetical protein